MIQAVISADAETQSSFLDLKKYLRYTICHKLVVSKIATDRMLNHWILTAVASAQVC